MINILMSTAFRRPPRGFAARHAISAGGADAALNIGSFKSISSDNLALNKSPQSNWFCGSVDHKTWSQHISVPPKIEAEGYKRAVVFFMEAGRLPSHSFLHTHTVQEVFGHLEFAVP